MIWRLRTSSQWREMPGEWGWALLEGFKGIITAYHEDPAAFFSPSRAARMTADALRGRSIDCAQSGTIQVVEVAADGDSRPIRIRFTARADRWPVHRAWETTFEPADVTDEDEPGTGEFDEAHAQELAANALTLLLEYLATGPGGGIREIDASPA